MLTVARPLGKGPPLYIRAGARGKRRGAIGARESPGGTTDHGVGVRRDRCVTARGSATRCDRASRESTARPPLASRGADRARAGRGSGRRHRRQQHHGEPEHREPHGPTKRIRTITRPTMKPTTAKRIRRDRWRVEVGAADLLDERGSSSASLRSISARILCSCSLSGIRVTFGRGADRPIDYTGGRRILRSDGDRAGSSIPVQQHRLRRRPPAEPGLDPVERPLHLTPVARRAGTRVALPQRGRAPWPPPRAAGSAGALPAATGRARRWRGAAPLRCRSAPRASGRG